MLKRTEQIQGKVKSWSDFKDLNQKKKQVIELKQIALIVNKFDKEEWSWWRNERKLPFFSLVLYLFFFNHLRKYSKPHRAIGFRIFVHTSKCRLFGRMIPTSTTGFSFLVNHFWDVADHIIKPKAVWEKTYKLESSVLKNFSRHTEHFHLLHLFNCHSNYILLCVSLQFFEYAFQVGYFT